MEIKWIHDSLHHFAYIDNPETSKFAGIITEFQDIDSGGEKLYHWDIKKRDDYSCVKLVKRGANRDLEVCMRNVVDNLKRSFQLV